MNSTHQQYVRFGAVLILLTVGLTVAMGAASAGSVASSAQESPTLENALEETNVPTAVEPNESFTVDASEISERADVDGACWLFDESETCHDVETDHTFEDVGPHTATLVVTDEDGDQRSVTNLISATTAPTAEVTAPESIEAGTAVTLDASDSSDDHEIIEYEWDLTGDGTVDETTTDPQLTTDFESDGSHDVTVTAVDTAGQTDTASTALEVADTSSLVDDSPATIIAILLMVSAVLLTVAGTFILSHRQRQ